MRPIQALFIKSISVQKRDFGSFQPLKRNLNIFKIPNENFLRVKRSCKLRKIIRFIYIANYIRSIIWLNLSNIFINRFLSIYAYVSLILISQKQRFFSQNLLRFIAKRHYSGPSRSPLFSIMLC